MADNYLERQYAAYEAKKAAQKRLGNGIKVQNRTAGSRLNKFYTRPVVDKTHEQRQAEIAAQLAHTQTSAEGHQ